MKQHSEFNANPPKPVRLEDYFEPFRNHIIGGNFEHRFRSGKRRLIYADWAASGRLYRPIERYISEGLGPYVANTHTDSTLTGRTTTAMYQQARQIIKRHVGAGPDDALLFAGFGMTAAVNKLQRILGLRINERLKRQVNLDENRRPLIIVTHMEHHSNQTSWQECLGDVTIIQRATDGTPDLDHLRAILAANRHRKLKIGAFTACSNVTGILTPYHDMAAIMHDNGGYCFVDFSTSAPYVNINMHPDTPDHHLDAIYFSPHKFLGGPGASGVLVFNKRLYRNRVPDHPGGGTVAWTNPWQEQRYYEDIEVREDGGTPGFLQAIKAALAVMLKEKMGVNQILAREYQLQRRLVDGLSNNPAIHILEPQQMQRLGIISFYCRNIHYNLIVKLLNDRFGIQSRGGCSCAGTYGHLLMGVNKMLSMSITKRIDEGDLSTKPGWVRVSLHPTMTDMEIDALIAAVEEIVDHYKQWREEYRFNSATGEFDRRDGADKYPDLRDASRLL